eukprot:6184119-Pleurochrysis_carterae.AAC.2
MWDIPRDPMPIGCIQSAAKFHVVPVATMIETVFYMGFRAIVTSSTESCRLCNYQYAVELVHVYIGIL